MTRFGYLVVLLCTSAALADPWEALELELPEPTQAAQVRAEVEEAQTAPATRNHTDDQPISRTGAAAASKQDKQAASNSEPGWVRSTLSLVAVVALIGLLAWGYRAATGNSGLPLGRPKRQGLIEVIARTALGPRQTVCLVRCGPRMVLVGLSGDRMTPLDTIDDPKLVADLAGEQMRRAAGAAEFNKVLQGEAQSYDEPEIDETTGADEGALAAAKRGLTETIERIRAARPQTTK